MLNKAAIEALLNQIKELESIRDQLMPGGGDLEPIFKKLDELYKELLEKLGHSEKPQATT